MAGPHSRAVDYDSKGLGCSEEFMFPWMQKRLLPRPHLESCWSKGYGKTRGESELSSFFSLTISRRFGWFYFMDAEMEV